MDNDPYGDKIIAETLDSAQDLFYTPRPKSRFIERIGKRIYRDATSCSCASCNDVTENGLVVCNKGHAEILFDYGIECGINYRDVK